MKQLKIWLSLVITVLVVMVDAQSKKSMKDRKGLVAEVSVDGAVAPVVQTVAAPQTKPSTQPEEQKTTVIGQLPQEVPAQTQEDSALGAWSAEDIEDYFAHMIIAGDVKLILSKLKDTTPTKALALAKRIVDNPEAPFDTIERVWLLLGMAKQYKDSKEDQAKFFEIIFDAQTSDLNGGKYAYLREIKTSPLEVAVKRGLEDVIPAMLAWEKDYRATLSPEIIEAKKLFGLRKQALQNVIDNDDFVMLKKMHEKGVHPDLQQDSELLYYLAKNNKNAQMVEFLVKTMGADVNYASPDGYTPLMQAAINNNADIAQALIDAGAQVSKAIKPEVGTALQLAIEHESTDVDILLRNYGARESMADFGEVLGGKQDRQTATIEPQSTDAPAASSTRRSKRKKNSRKKEAQQLGAPTESHNESTEPKNDVEKSSENSAEQAVTAHHPEM